MKDKLRKYIEENYEKTIIQKSRMMSANFGGACCEECLAPDINTFIKQKVHIDRRLFSKIRNDNNYHPSKETIILLGLSLELSEHEIEELLDSASYSLPKNNYYDLIIRFCFINKMFKLSKVNSLLDEYHCKLFNY